MSDTNESLKGTFEVHSDGSVSGLSHHGVAFSFGADLLTKQYGGGAEYGARLETAGFKRCGCITFPSGATVTVTGGYITGRVGPEPQRAPLPESDAWRYTGKERDDFQGFTVNSSEAIDYILPANRPAPKGSTLHAHPGKGSALLLG